MKSYGLIIGFAYLVTILVFFGYLVDFHRLLRRVSPGNRAMKPALVWLQLVPFLGAAWQFIVVRRVSRAFLQEWSSLGSSPAPHSTPRFAVCKAAVDALALASVAATLFLLVHQHFALGYLALSFFCCALLQLASLSLWMAYWVEATMRSHKVGWHHLRHGLGSGPAHPSGTH